MHHVLLLAHGSRVTLLMLLLLLHHLSALGIAHSGVPHSRPHAWMKHALLLVTI